MPPKASAKASAKAQKAKAKKEKQLLEARIKSCQEKCTEARDFLEPSARNTEPNFAKAKAALDAAIEEYSASALPFFLLGQWNRLQGMSKEAIESYSHALDLDPRNVQALEWRGHCYQVLCDYPHAIEDNTSILALDPENDHAYNMRGLCILQNSIPGLRLRSVDFESCVRDFSTAIRLNEANYYAMANLGKAYEVQGHFDKAIDCYGRALQINEAYTYAKYRRGCTALHMAEAALLREKEESETCEEAAQNTTADSAAGAQGSSSNCAGRSQRPGAKGDAHGSVRGPTTLTEVKAAIRQQLAEESAAKTTEKLLRIAEGDFTALMKTVPEGDRLAADVTVVLNLGICALLKKDVKRAGECFKQVQELLSKNPGDTEGAGELDNAEGIKEVLSIRQDELKREKERLRSAAGG